MTKVRRLSELSQSLPFTEYDFYDLYLKTFENTELGRMKKVLPLRQMAETFGLASKRQVPKRGAKPYFTPEGKVALMFLKTYTQLSAPKLMEQLNGNIHYQIFCDIRIDPENTLQEIRRMEREHGGGELLTVKEKPLVDIVTKVYRQQHNHFDSGNRRESIPDRIVSVSKPYVRPIVRGKEVKGVEFGAKCNNIMVDGISFIEKLSFNAFNEGTRLQHCVKMHRRLFGVDVKKIGGDTSYAGTDNCDFCKENGIQTSFVKRGRPSQEKKETDFVRQELARVRATAMEGSFGTQKEHYAMRRIKARKKETEILYIFFGIHTANAVRLAERLLERLKAEAA